MSPADVAMLALLMLAFIQLGLLLYLLDRLRQAEQDAARRFARLAETVDSVLFSLPRGEVSFGTALPWSSVIAGTLIASPPATVFTDDDEVSGE